MFWLPLPVVFVCRFLGGLSCILPFPLFLSLPWLGIDNFMEWFGCLCKVLYVFAVISNCPSKGVEFLWVSWYRPVLDNFHFFWVTLDSSLRNSLPKKSNFFTQKKTHLDSSTFNPCSPRRCRTKSNCSKPSSMVLEYTIISSKKTMSISLISLLKISCINLWKTCGDFFIPKDINRYS